MREITMKEWKSKKRHGYAHTIKDKTTGILDRYILGWVDGKGTSLIPVVITLGRGA